MKTSRIRIKEKIMILDFKRRKKAMNNELTKIKIDERKIGRAHV